MSRALKQEDERELSKLYEAEFNQPDLHDRVLAFNVVASWPHSVSDVNEENETSEACGQSEDGDDSKTIEISSEATDVNARNENKAGSQDCETDTKNANGDQQIKIGTNLPDNKEITEEKETADLDKQETVAKDDINQKTSHGNEIKNQQESETSSDGNDADLSLTNKEQTEDSNEIFSQSNEAKSFPTSEEQVIRQHKFYIHSTWLAVQSSYFRSLFYSGMKESNVKEVHVQISASEEKAHLMLLEAMYKIDTLDNASLDELLDVLKLAHKYDVKFVFKKSKYCLQTVVDSLEVCEKIMHFIKVDNTITDVEDLANTLQSFLAQEFSPLDNTWQTSSFEELCETSIRHLLSSDELRTESENTIFHALMYWIKQLGIEHVLGAGGTPSILSVVRFELISIDYLYNIVQHHSIAKKFPDFNLYYLRGISYHALSSNIRETLNNKPVKRDVKPAHTDGVVMLQASPNFISRFTWVIPRDKLDTLIGNDKELKSDEFWYCGYKTVLAISNVKKRKTQYIGNNKESFNAKLSLDILNVKQHSVIEISWNVASQANNCRSQSGETRHTFRKGANISSIDISYEVEVKRKIQQPATTAAFTFSSTTAGAASLFGSSIPQVSSSTGFSFGTSSGTKPLEKTHADLVPKKEHPDVPCLSIDIHMKLV